ncbi:MAG TPA: CYTH domain-containing protein [Ilumatobacteraceae bacterium]|nr:CYTH domain-containing protein [Ilumatobacteraceae bacterium]
MTIEIERKFVLAETPGDDVLGPGELLRQGYLAEEGDVTVRLRITERAAMLTIKAGAGLSRTEVEVRIARHEAGALWSHTAGRRIEKTRHRVAHHDLGDHVADVDVYAGPLAGLCTAEVEFDSEDDAVSFAPPSWFGREVTGERAWSNAALARNGLPH